MKKGIASSGLVFVLGILGVLLTLIMLNASASNFELLFPNQTKGLNTSGLTYVSGTITLVINLSNQPSEANITNVTFWYSGADGLTKTKIISQNGSDQAGTSNGSASRSIGQNISKYNWDTTGVNDGTYHIWVDLANETDADGTSAVHFYTNGSIAAGGNDTDAGAKIIIDNTAPNITVARVSNNSCWSWSANRGTAVADPSFESKTGLTLNGTWTDGLAGVGKVISNHSNFTNVLNNASSKNYTSNILWNLTNVSDLKSGYHNVLITVNDSINESSSWLSGNTTTSNSRSSFIQFLVDSVDPSFAKSGKDKLYISSLDDTQKVSTDDRYTTELGHFKIFSGEKIKFNCDFTEDNLRSITYYIKGPSNSEFHTLSSAPGYSDCGSTSKTCTFTNTVTTGIYEIYCNIEDGTSNSTCNIVNSKDDGNALKFEVRADADLGLAEDLGEEEEVSPPATVPEVTPEEEQGVGVGRAGEAGTGVGLEEAVTPKRWVGIWIIVGIVVIGLLVYWFGIRKK